MSFIEPSSNQAKNVPAGLAPRICQYIFLKLDVANVPRKIIMPVLN